MTVYVVKETYSGSLFGIYSTVERAETAKKGFEEKILINGFFVIELWDVDAGIADVELDSNEHEFLRLKQKIPAIKAYRQRTGVGLKEAKDHIEKMMIKHGYGYERPVGMGLSGNTEVVFNRRSQGA